MVVVKQVTPGKLTGAMKTLEEGTRARYASFMGFDLEMRPREARLGPVAWSYGWWHVYRISRAVGTWNEELMALLFCESRQSEEPGDGVRYR
jgi:hypothetical protein